MDHVLGSKRATYRALRLYQEQANEPELRLPPTGEMRSIPRTDPDAPFPNLVYKLPEIEQGRGVWFLKAQSTEHARTVVAEALRVPRRRSLEERASLAMTSKEGVFQPFIASKLVEDRRLYKVRAFVLVSPAGVRCVSAHRMIASQPVPETLDFGMVRDMAPYMINTAAGGSMRVLADDEWPGVAGAAEAVARGFAWAVERSFRVGPG